MAEQTTDRWTRTFTVNLAGTREAHTVVLTEQGDGVDDPAISATVDGLPVEVTVASEVLVDGITPAWIDRPACSYRAIDGEDLAEHQTLNHPSPPQERGKPVRIVLTADDFADLQEGAAITTLADDGREVSLGPEGSRADGWLDPADLTDLAAGLSVETVSGDGVALSIQPPSTTALGSAASSTA